MKSTKRFILFSSDLKDFLLPSARFYCTFILGAAVVVIEAATIWHEFVLYEDFVLYGMAEQLNKLHSAFGAFSETRDCERNIVSRNGIKSRAWCIRLLCISNLSIISFFFFVFPSFSVASRVDRLLSRILGKCNSRTEREDRG